MAFPQKLLSLFSLFFKKKITPMTDNSVLNQTQQIQTQAQGIDGRAGNILSGIQQVADVAALIPGAAPAAGAVKEVAAALQVAEPAVDSVLGALLPLLRAAGHNIGDEYEHLVAAAKSVAK